MSHYIFTPVQNEETVSHVNISVCVWCVCVVCVWCVCGVCEYMGWHSDSEGVSPCNSDFQHSSRLTSTTRKGLTVVSSRLVSDQLLRSNSTLLE